MTFVLEINSKLKKTGDLNKIIKWEQFKILSNRLIFHRSSYNYPSGVWKRAEFFYIEKIRFVLMGSNMFDASSELWKRTDIIQNIRFVLKRNNMYDAPCIMISLSLQ
jgi:hypothetical protein